MLVKTEKEIDELMATLKEDLKDAKKAGCEGITFIRQTHKFMPPSELKFTFEQGGVKFEGYTQEIEAIRLIIATVLAAASPTT